MKSLFETLQTREQPKSKTVNKRQDLLREILEEVNKERQGTKYKPLQAKALAVKLGHVPTEDLYPFHRQCMDYKHRKGSYNKCLFGSLKVK